MIARRALLGAAAAGLARPALGQPRRVVRLAVLSSFSGEYADGAGEGSVIAARLAAEDVQRALSPGFTVEVVQGDMLDKPDVGAGLARAWFDRDAVDAVVDVPNSAVAMAVATVARERNRVALLSGPGLAAISGAQCGPNHVQWTYDTRALATVTGRAVVAEGGDSWFFITADYSFGRGLEADTARVVAEQGGRVLGGVTFPFPNTTDFSSFLVQAQSSGARVLGLACTGNNFSNVVKQAAEFGIGRAREGRPGQRLASLLCLLTNVHAIGLADAQGLLLASPFYWDLDDGTRAFTRRFAPLFRGNHPTMVQAGAYSAVTHYLKALASLPAAAQADGAAVVARMKSLPAEDALFGRSTVRANGSVAHDMHLFQVKAPGESAGAWDYYRKLRTVPAAEAFGPPAAACTLL